MGAYYDYLTTVGEYWDRQIKIAVAKQKEIAGNMKRKDLPVDLIAEVTGLSEEEVRKL